ncbi:MAG: hypothetical protein QOJ32_2662 [Frankiaceae bacterium]|nr:hypothetical protein [Frankiaceae bacterium]
MRARPWRVGTSVALGGLLALSLVQCAPDRDNEPPAPSVPRLANPESWSARYVAGSRPIVDSSSRRWEPDEAVARGGDLQSTSQEITGTSSPELYRQQRSGLDGYSIPVPASGTYEVDLLMTETKESSVGSRVFDISAEGRPMVSDVDIFARSGLTSAHHEVLVVAVQDGALDLSFRASHGAAHISAVSVAFVSLGTGTDRPIFTDDFDGPAGSSPDPGVWNHETGGDGWGNSELQTYTRSTANSAVDGSGRLVITARRESRTGADGIQRGYTSARLTTKGNVAFRYGAISARLQVPAGKGLLPAFWTLGSDIDRVRWPASGEIDVAEVKGDTPDEVHGTLHGPVSGSHDDYQRGASRIAGGSLADAFHTYSATWLPNTVSLFLDGQRYAVLSRADLAVGEGWPFDKPHYLLLNLAVGGDSPGSPDQNTPFPARLLADQVRVTQW